jgi:D-xylose transport system substrate-binding protein
MYVRMKRTARLAKAAGGLAPSQRQSFGRKTMQSGKLRSVAAAAAVAALIGGAAHAADVDGPAGKLPQYTGQGLVGFDIYNGAVSRWAQHDIPNLTACLKAYAPNVKLVTADPRGDAATQMSQVQSMLVQGVNVLLMTPVALTPTNVVQAAKRSGVPVIVYLNPPVGLHDGDINAVVGDGPIPIGVAQGQWIEKTQPDGAEIALINGDLATNYALLMQKGQKSVLQKDFDSGKFKLVADKGAVNWDPSDAQKQAAAVLIANPNVKAFVVGNDGLSGGVINAIKNAGKTGQIAVIGLDGDVQGSQNILQGNQTATVIKSFNDEMNNACVAVIYALNKTPIPKDKFPDTWNDQTAPVPFKDIDVTVIDKSNISKAIDIGSVTKEDMCKGLPAGIGAPCS